jgi:hypothetical protein
MSSPSSPPSSRRPAGVPESGNAKYAIVALLLLGGTAGIYFWRSAANKDVPVPIPSATVAQSAEAPSNPKLDDIPLPPPPDEEKPEAGPPPKVVYVQTGGCEAKCSGVAPPELEQALQVRGAQARRCYNQALAQDSSLKGHVVIGVKIGSSGSLCSANVVSNDMGSAAVAACAANIFRANSAYPSPHGGCVEASVPLSFVPQGQ